MLDNETQKYMYNLWLWSCGIQERDLNRRPSLSELQRNEWCEEFEKFRRNRMILGAFRYGEISKQDLSKFNMTKEAIRRINLYISDGNIEHLVDASNMIMIEYIKQRKHFGKQLLSIDDAQHNCEHVQN